MQSDPKHFDDHPLAPFVQRLRLHCSLGDADVREILDLPFKKLNRNQYSHLLRDGDSTHHCMVLLSGLVERYRLTSHGERQILAIYIPGDPLDLEHLFIPLADDWLQTLRRSEIALIEHDALRALNFRRPAIATALICSLLVDASIFREWTINVGRRNAKARIAHFLSELIFRMRAQGINGKDIILPLTQYHIADATGLTAVHVNRTLKAMQSDNLLSTKGGAIRSIDWVRIREVGDFNSRYLHSNHEDDE